MGSSRVIALDMIDESNDLYRILSAITTQHKLPPNRSWCMHCKKIFSNNTRCIHCKHCSRLTCEECIHSCLPPEYFPKNFKLTESSWACIVCERILTSQKEVLSNVTHPVSSYGEYDDEDRFSC